VFEGDGVVGLVGGAGFVLAGAKVLDLLAGILDLGEAEGGGGAFEEVPELGEFEKVFVGATGG
jgi:hypothetical protein